MDYFSKQHMYYTSCKIFAPWLKIRHGQVVLNIHHFRWTKTTVKCQEVRFISKRESTLQERSNLNNPTFHIILS